MCVCVTDVGRLVEGGRKRGQGKGCREADTTVSLKTCPERPKGVVSRTDRVGSTLGDIHGGWAWG